MESRFNPHLGSAGNLVPCYPASCHSLTCESFFKTKFVVICTSHVRVASIISHGCTHVVPWPSRGPLHTRARSHQGNRTDLTQVYTCQIIFSSLPMARRCLRSGRKIPDAYMVYINAILSQSILPSRIEARANTNSLKARFVLVNRLCLQREFT